MRVNRAICAALVCLAAPCQADIAYVTCQPGEELSLINIDTGTEVGRWPLPGKPAGVAVAGSSIYTVAPDSKVVRRHNRQGALLARATLDGGPIGVAVDAPRGRIFVTDWYNARIWALNSETLTPLETLATGAAPAGLDLSDDGRFLASADKEANQVSLFDAETLTLIATLPVGTRPFGLRFDASGRLFVGNVGSNDVTVIDPDQQATLATVPVGTRPYGVTFAAGHAFVTDQYDNTVTPIDLQTLAPSSPFDVGEYPEGIDTSNDGTKIVLANWFDNTVSIVDAKSQDIVYTVDTCDGPRAFGRFVLGGEQE